MLKSILLVDDDEDDREFFLSVLELIDPSMICETAPNGSIALQRLAAGKVLPGLIFLDLNMPVMNGVQFLAEVKKNPVLKSIAIVILSTSADVASMSQTASLGAVDFIVKPNKLSLLESRLREILNNPIYLQAQ